MITYLVLRIDPRVQLVAQDHHTELLLDRFSRGGKSRIQAIQSHAREGNEVLDDALAPDQVIELVDVPVEVDIQEVISTVGLEDL